MKVKQIVGEHKKGMRAKKYARKPQKYIEPIKPKGPGEDVKETANVTVKPVTGATEVDINGQKVATTTDATSAATIAQLAKDGKLAINPSTQPNQPTGGTAPMEEQPSGPTYLVNTKVNPPMVLVNGNTGGVPLQPASGELTPELIARSKPDWQEVYVQANGKQYPALATHRVIKVSPSVYQQIVGAQIRENEELNAMLTIAGLR